METTRFKRFASTTGPSEGDCAHAHADRDGAIACARFRGALFVLAFETTTIPDPHAPNIGPDWRRVGDHYEMETSVRWESLGDLHTAQCREAMACAHPHPTCVCALGVCAECGGVLTDDEEPRCATDCASCA
jgi:hypothetical protein